MLVGVVMAHPAGTAESGVALAEGNPPPGVQQNNWNFNGLFKKSTRLAVVNMYRRLERVDENSVVFFSATNRVGRPEYRVYAPCTMIQRRFLLVVATFFAVFKRRRGIRTFQQLSFDDRELPPPQLYSFPWH